MKKRITASVILLVIALAILVFNIFFAKRLIKDFHVIGNFLDEFGDLLLIFGITISSFAPACLSFPCIFNAIKMIQESKPESKHIFPIIVLVLSGICTISLFFMPLFLSI